MLHGATAAYAEIRTGGLHPLRGWLDYPFQPGGIEAWLLPHDARQHFFARQGAVDKHNLALAARNAAGFKVEGLYIKYFKRHYPEIQESRHEFYSDAGRASWPRKGWIENGRASWRARV